MYLMTFSRAEPAPTGYRMHLWERALLAKGPAQPIHNRLL